MLNTRTSAFVCSFSQNRLSSASRRCSGASSSLLACLTRSSPDLHHPFDEHGHPLDGEPTQGRRPSRYIVRVAASRKRASAAQSSLDLGTYDENALVNGRDAARGRRYS